MHTVTTRHHWLARPEDRVIVVVTLQGATAVLELTNKTAEITKGQLRIDAEKNLCQHGQSEQEGSGCFVSLDTHILTNWPNQLGSLLQYLIQTSSPRVMLKVASLTYISPRAQRAILEANRPLSAVSVLPEAFRLSFSLHRLRGSKSAEVPFSTA